MEHTDLARYNQSHIEKWVTYNNVVHDPLCILKSLLEARSNKE